MCGDCFNKPEVSLLDEGYSHGIRASLDRWPALTKADLSVS